MGKAIIYYIVLVLAAAGTIFYFVQKNTHFDDRYDPKIINEVTISSGIPGYELTGYQSLLTVVPHDQDINSSQFEQDTYAVLMVNNEDRVPVVAYNALRRIYPASTTKLMTGIVVCDALEKGEISLEDEVTLSHDTVIDEEGAVVSYLNSGCTITVRNLLYGLMMRSYNDFAVITH